MLNALLFLLRVLETCFSIIFLSASSSSKMRYVDGDNSVFNINSCPVSESRLTHIFGMWDNYIEEL